MAFKESLEVDWWGKTASRPYRGKPPSTRKKKGDPRVISPPFWPDKLGGGGSVTVSIERARKKEKSWYRGPEHLVKQK